MSLTESGLCKEHGKVPFTLHQIRQIRKTRNSGAWYKCEHCKGYHITSRSFDGKKKKLNKPARKQPAIIGSTKKRKIPALRLMSLLPREPKAKEVKVIRNSVFNTRVSNELAKLNTWRKSLIKLIDKLNPFLSDHSNSIDVLALLKTGAKPSEFMSSDYLERGKRIRGTRDKIQKELDRVNIWKRTLDGMNKMNANTTNDETVKTLTEKLERLVKGFNETSSNIGKLRTEVQNLVQLYDDRDPDSEPSETLSSDAPLEDSPS